ncbi:MAG: sigma-70 family RNA polymerase sigma factor [Marinilabiliales bacterium]|nr:sigma-70 family RNA polymerase sigma factor [Marinilabiliales bacterium]
MDKPEQQQLFEQILELHKGILFKVAHAYYPDAKDRQDLVQEMMLQIWKSINRYDDQFKMTTWLYRISLNVAISYHRKNSTRHQKFSKLTDQMVDIPMEDKSDNEIKLNLLEQFIGELKEIDKALMILYLEEKSHAEIADILGLSISNVGTKIGRIKEQLKLKFSHLKSESHE